MFGLVDLAAGLVLRVIDLLLLLPGELAAVGLPVRRDLLINSLFVIFEFCGLPGLQRAAANALRDAILLILATLPDLIVPVMRGVGIGLILMDLIAQMVLLLVDLLLFRLRKLASVGLPVVVHLAVEIGLLAFQILGFAGGQLAGLNAIGDAVLLIVAPLIHGGRVLRKRYRAA